MKKIQTPIKQENKFMSVLKILLVLILVSFVLASCISLSISDDSVNLMDKNVAIIPIDGMITLQSVESPFYTQSSSQDVLDFIQTVDGMDNIKAVVFEINSPGGTVVASAEIVDAIKSLNKTKVAWVREIGTSGAYWAASSCDYIVAHDMSMVGSIGVIGSYLDFGGFLNDHNITYNRMIAGKYKDMGSPLKNLTDEEREIMQKKMDLIHEYFIKEVSKNRNMQYEEVEELATGEYYLGIEAIENGLVDELGNYKNVVSHIENELNITVMAAKLQKQKGFFEQLTGVSSDSSYSVGRGIGDSLISRRDSSIPLLN